jgi:hypothetical protein
MKGIDGCLNKKKPIDADLLLEDFVLFYIFLITFLLSL